MLMSVVAGITESSHFYILLDDLTIHSGWSLCHWNMRESFYLTSTLMNYLAYQFDY